MIYTQTTLVATYDVRLVTLSIVIAVFGSYIGLDLAGQVLVAQGWTRQLWLSGGMIALGISIWAMHFIAMLAFQLPIPIVYDFTLVILSMVVAIGGTGAGLFVITKKQSLDHLPLVAGAGLIGLGIVSLHMTAMSAMQVAALMVYDPKLMALSTATAIGGSGSAVWLAFHSRAETLILVCGRKIGSVILMGTAIVGMHYLAMAAVNFQDHQLGVPSSVASNNAQLAVTVGIGTLVILILTLVASFFGQRSSARSARAEAQRQSEERFRSLVQNASDVIVILAADYTVGYLSPSFKRLMGDEPEAMLGKKALDLLHPEDLTKAKSLLSEAQRCPAVNLTTELRLQHTDCSWRDFEVVVNNLLLEPSVAGIVATCRDITERKRAEEVLLRAKLAEMANQKLQKEITNRQQTEEALRQSEHQLRLVTDNVPVFIAYYDTERRYRFINRRYAECFGLRPEEAIGKRIPEVVGEAAYCSLQEYVDTALSGQAVEFEVEVPFETIGPRWLHIGYVPDFNGRKEVRGLFAVISDISDRKQAETALHNSEAKFRAVFEQMYQFMGLLTPDGTLLEVNQAPLTFANVEHSAVIGQPFWEFPSWKVTAELQEIAKTAFAQAGLGQFFHKEVSIPDGNGQLYTFDVSVKPITAPESNQIVWLLVEGRNISTLVRLQGALRQEQERSLQLINSSVDGIVAFDANGCCTLWNPAMKQLTGIQQEEVMGKSGMDVFSAFLDAKTMQSFAFGTAETATALDLHFINLKTGQRQWVEARYSPLHDGDDTPHGGLMMVQDVTKQRELEWMKREFISIISHEIRTPLSSIRGSLGLVASGLLDDDPETAKEMLGIANNNIERLVRLVNDILALNRLESGQVKLKKQWCDEAALVQQAFSNVQNLAHSNQITLQSSVPGIQIWADPDWLVQVLVNLINNAVKFSPAGTTVSVSTQTQTQQVFFQVTDQGRGIPTDKLETIFGQSSVYILL